MARGSNQPFYIFRVACKNHRPLAQRDGNNNSINHISSSGLSQQAPRGVRIALAERHNETSSQEAAKLSLLPRPADLGDDRCGNHRNKAKF